MKVKLYIDLNNDFITEEKYAMAYGNVSSQKMSDQTRYLLEVDLPIHHFRAVADRKVEAVVIGKEEE